MKYNIEGQIDFFSELYKSLDDADKIETDNNVCLITNQPLTDKFIELNCGHKFNYISLYNDVYNHKLKFNALEGNASKLKTNEIRCPYCRKKHEGVLPYYPDLVSAKNNGVNFLDDTISIQPSADAYSFGQCEFIITSTDNISCKCPIVYVTKLEFDNKTYCWKHDKIMNKKFEKEKQKKLKDETKQKEKEEKLKAKEEKLKAKEEEKQKKIDEKLLKNKNKNKKKKENNLILSITDVEEENIVITSLIKSNNTTESQDEQQNKNGVCVQIIKTGTNKGNHCGLEIFNDCLCKRHYNLKNKK